MRNNVLEIVTLEEIYYFVWFHDQTVFFTRKRVFNGVLVLIDKLFNFHA